MSDIKIPDLNIPTPQNSNAPTGKTVAQEEAEKQAALEAELEAEYIDKRQIIIALFLIILLIVELIWLLLESHVTPLVLLLIQFVNLCLIKVKLNITSQS